jgi:hypothetical protein
MGLQSCGNEPKQKRVVLLIITGEIPFNT